MYVSNFNSVELQTLAVTDTASGVKFSAQAAKSRDLMVVNDGPNGVFLATGTGAAVAVATAPFGREYYVPAGAVMVIQKGIDDTIAAVCGSGKTATLYLHAGVGT